MSEDLGDAVARCENISKPDYDAMLAQHDLFGCSLGSAKNGDRHYCLVSGDQHHARRICRSRFGDQFRGQHIVGDRRDCLLLQQRDMFERSGVKDKIRCGSGEHFFEHAGVGHIA